MGLTVIGSAILIITARSRRERQWPHPPIVVSRPRDEKFTADAYNHDLYSRDVAAKAIRKYNDHIERCNRAIEVGQHGPVVEDSDLDHSSWRVKLEQVTEERNCYLRERDCAQKELDTNRRTLAELSQRLDKMSSKPGGNGKTSSSTELSQRVSLLPSDYPVLPSVLAQERQSSCKDCEHGAVAFARRDEAVRILFLVLVSGEMLLQSRKESRESCAHLCGRMQRIVYSSGFVAR
jgi:hypothetical protein